MFVWKKEINSDNRRNFALVFFLQWSQGKAEFLSLYICIAKTFCIYCVSTRRNRLISVPRLSAVYELYVF